MYLLKSININIYYFNISYDSTTQHVMMYHILKKAQSKQYICVSMYIPLMRLFFVIHSYRFYFKQTRVKRLVFA